MAEEKYLESRPEIFAETCASIQTCLTNIRNTNAFMLMAINRCLDYTKASKGMKLVPKYETVDLREALKFPVECMSNVQERIGIKLGALSEEICSHIITDKHWLQENLLLLLSNAVKYSTEGNVTITVTRTTSKSISKPAAFRLSKTFSSLFVKQSSSITNKIVPTVLTNDSEHEIEEWFLLFEIEDTGIGISEEKAKNLFNPFKQAQRLAGGRVLERGRIWRKDLYFGLLCLTNLIQRQLPQKIMFSINHFLAIISNLSPRIASIPTLMMF